MKSSAQLRGAAGHADPAADFVTGDQRGDKSLAVDVTDTTHERVCSRDRFRAGVDDADTVQVIHLEAVDQRAVGQGRAGARNLRAVAPDERALAFAHLLGERSDDLSPRQRRAEKRAAERIDEAELDVRNHLLGDVFIREPRDVFSQSLSRRVRRGEFS